MVLVFKRERGARGSLELWYPPQPRNTLSSHRFQDMDEQQVNVPLLQDCSATLQPHNQDIVARFWIESKKLWHIVGPSIFSRIISYSILIIAQAFAGHLNDLDLAAFSIAVTVVIGFDMGLLVGTKTVTLCVSTTNSVFL